MLMLPSPNCLPKHDPPLMPRPHPSPYRTPSLIDALATAWATDEAGSHTGRLYRFWVYKALLHLVVLLAVLLALFAIIIWGAASTRQRDVGLSPSWDLPNSEPGYGHPAPAAPSGDCINSPCDPSR